MADLKRDLEEYDESITLLKELEKSFENIVIEKNDIWYSNFLQEKLNVLVQIGQVYKRKTREDKYFFDSTNVYYDKTFLFSQYIDSSNNNFKYQHFIRKAYLYESVGSSTEALKYANQSIPYMGPEDGEGVFSIKAEIFSSLKQADSSIIYGKKYLRALRKYDGGNNTNNIRIYRVLAENHETLNQLDSAYKYSQLIIQELDRVDSIKTKTLSSVFKDEKAQLENEKNEINKGRSLFSKAFIGTSVLVVLLLIGFAVRRNTQKKKFDTLKEQYLNLTKNEIIPKKQEYTIDDKVIVDILNELSKIEDSELYLNPDFNLNILAKLLKTNTSYLSQIINEYKKQPFRQYLSELRIEFLLKQIDKNDKLKNYTIAALGEMIGYTNASAFTRAFKKYKGINPSEFLKNKYGDLI